MESAGSHDAEPSTCPLAGLAAADGTLPLASFHRNEEPLVKIVPATRWRDWMNDTTERFANRCLPLLMANQAGWMLLNPAPFEATWDGGDSKGSLTIAYPDGTPEERQVAVSHFGFGIVTFVFQDMLSTPPGYNLFARGPTNSPKDGICALDGLVETDWSAAPFTMNWKLTRPGTVAFAEDEPFCQIIPQRRGELESFRPQFRRLRAGTPLSRRVAAWTTARLMVQLGKQSTKSSGNEKWRRFWFEDYFKGHSPTGETSDEHQTTLRLASFERDPDA
jgi:hypothetical protein